MPAPTDADHTRIYRQAKRRRSNLLRLLLLGLVAAAYWFYSFNGSTFSTGFETEVPDAPAYEQGVTATVERVVDGDTIVAQVDGASERVRLLNIDTPESVQPDTPVECLGPEASAFLTTLLPPGTAVTLEFDRDRRDQYDRMLAGVVMTDGTLVNAAIARAGFAELLEIGGNDRFTPDVASAVAEAQGAAVGLWAPGACG